MLIGTQNQSVIYIPPSNSPDALGPAWQITFGIFGAVGVLATVLSTNCQSSLAATLYTRVRVQHGGRIIVHLNIPPLTQDSPDAARGVFPVVDHSFLNTNPSLLSLDPTSFGTPIIDASSLNSLSSHSTYPTITVSVSPDATDTSSGLSRYQILEDPPQTTSCAGEGRSKPTHYSLPAHCDALASLQRPKPAALASTVLHHAYRTRT